MHSLHQSLKIGLSHKTCSLISGLPPKVAYERLVSQAANGNLDFSIYINGKELREIDASQTVLEPSALLGFFKFKPRRNLDFALLLDRLSTLSITFNSATQGFSELRMRDVALMDPKSKEIPSVCKNLDAVKKCAKLALIRLEKVSDFTLGEAILCTCVVRSITQEDIKEVCEDPRITADVFSRVFCQNLFTKLPQFFPWAFANLPHQGVDFSQSDCIRMGVPNTKVELATTVEILQAPTSKLRESAIGASANSLRWMMLKKEVEGTLPWLFKKMPCPSTFHNNPVMEALPLHGFRRLQAEPRQSGDIVVYLAGESVVHYAVIPTINEVSEYGDKKFKFEKDCVLSKWERMPPMLHPIDALPTPIKGTQVVFFRHETLDTKELRGEICRTFESFIAALEEKPIMWKGHTFILLGVVAEIYLMQIETLNTDDAQIFDKEFYQNQCNNLAKSLTTIVNQTFITPDKAIVMLKTLYNDIKSGKHFREYFQTPEYQTHLDKVFRSLIEAPAIDSV